MPWEREEGKVGSIGISPQRLRAVTCVRRALVVACALLAFAGCADAGPAAPAAQRTASPTPTAVPYLGQQPPGREPEVFAPGIVSDPGTTEFSGSPAPDAGEYYFYRFSEDSPARLLVSKVVDGELTAPRQLRCSAGYGASEPLVTSDGKRLYFMWDHPVPAGKPHLPSYFVVDRTQDGWSRPQYAGQGMFLSTTRDGQMYTTDMSTMNAGTTSLAEVTTSNGRFTDYEKVAIPGIYGSQAHPCIAPDGTYILYDINGGAHLFVSFRHEDGSWGDPIDLTQHGFDPAAGGACVSPDGKYLFFALRDDIWWVDASVVEDLGPKQ
jgi:hypothetical protein